MSAHRLSVQRRHARSLQSILLVAMFVMLTTAASWAEQGVTQQFTQLQAIGSGSLDSGAGVDVPSDTTLERPRVNLDAVTAESVDIVASLQAMAAASLTFPTVPNSKVAGSNHHFSGFDGLDHRDQRLAGTGAFTNTQFSTEPPDQGLCVGNGFVLETVNVASAVYSSTGTLLAGPTALNQFFGLSPEVIRANPPVFGNFTSDPRCLYDAETNRFFVTLLEIGVDPASGNFNGESSQLLAVSKSGDPTGGWNLYRLTTTNDGSADCPCFGDQPLIGLDANGFYLSANSFSIAVGAFRGVQIYAASKRALAAGVLPPFVLHISLPRQTQADGSRAFSLQPAVEPGEDEESGTEYFLASFHTRVLLNNKVQVFALRNTRLLNFPPTPTTHFSFMRAVVDSEVYGVPPDATQKRGPLVLGPLHDPKVFELLSTGDHRMQQVTLAGDKLWGSVTTGLASPGESALKSGVAWFAVRVSTDDGQLRAHMQSQGYVALANANLHYPAVGIRGESGAIGFSLSGPNYFPSTGYVHVSLGGTGDIHIAGMGTGSEDGFSGYPNESSVPPPCTPPAPDGSQLCSARWGDYGAAAVDREGAIWLANEYIGPRPRTLFANWGTFVTRLGPQD